MLNTHACTYVGIRSKQKHGDPPYPRRCLGGVVVTPPTLKSRGLLLLALSIILLIVLILIVLIVLIVLIILVMIMVMIIVMIIVVISRDSSPPDESFN